MDPADKYDKHTTYITYTYTSTCREFQGDFPEHHRLCLRSPISRMDGVSPVGSFLVTDVRAGIETRSACSTTL